MFRHLCLAYCRSYRITESRFHVDSNYLTVSAFSALHLRQFCKPFLFFSFFRQFFFFLSHLALFLFPYFFRHVLSFVSHSHSPSYLISEMCPSAQDLDWRLEGVAPRPKSSLDELWRWHARSEPLSEGSGFSEKFLDVFFFSVIRRYIFFVARFEAFSVFSWVNVRFVTYFNFFLIFKLLELTENNYFGVNESLFF